MIELNCRYVTSSEAGGEIYQVVFKADRAQEDGPYVLISRAFLEEDEDDDPSIYIETHDARINGHYPMVDVKLDRNNFKLTLPAPSNEIIDVHFSIPEKTFQKISLTLGVILQQ